MSELRTNGTVEKSKEDQGDTAVLVHRKNVLSKLDPQPTQTKSLSVTGSVPLGPRPLALAWQLVS